jgi:hypothetical protein
MLKLLITNFFAEDGRNRLNLAKKKDMWAKTPKNFFFFFGWQTFNSSESVSKGKLKK